MRIYYKSWFGHRASFESDDLLIYRSSSYTSSTVKSSKMTLNMHFGVIIHNIHGDVLFLIYILRQQRILHLLCPTNIWNWVLYDAKSMIWKAFCRVLYGVDCILLGWGRGCMGFYLPYENFGKEDIVFKMKGHGDANGTIYCKNTIGHSSKSWFCNGHSFGTCLML